MSGAVNHAVLPGSAIIVDPPASQSKLADVSISAAQCIKEAAWPELDEELVEAAVRPAVAEVRATAPPPIDAEESVVDRWALDAVTALSAREEKAHRAVEEAQEKASADRRALAELPKPLGVMARVALVLGLIVLGLGAALGTAFLLGPAIGTFFTRSAAAAVWGESDRAMAVILAHGVAFALAAALLLTQVVTTVILWGKGSGAKWAFILADLVFAAAFTLLRAGERASFASIAAGLFEFAVIGTVGVAVALIHERLKHDAERLEPFRRARSLLRAAMAELEAARAFHAGIRQELAAQVSELARRDAAARTLDARATLVEEKARTAAIVASAAILAKGTSDPAADVVHELMNEELKTAHRDHRKVAESRRYR